MEIKDIIRNKRLEMGLTMKQVADAVGVSEGTVSRWESGEIENMRRDKIAALSKLLSIDPRIIMGWQLQTDDNEPNEKQQHSGYYTNPETAKVAQQIFDDPDLHALFDAARDSRPEDLLMAADLLRRLKGTNPDG
jgi:transcriptional regulator with XRE-family HTH domain